MRTRRVAIAFAVALVASYGLSFLHPWGKPQPAPGSASPLLAGRGQPDRVLQVIAAKCADCHSANTHYPVYARLAPASWMIERDVMEGRSHLDLSQWQYYGAEEQIDRLTKIAAEVRSGQMPPRRYVLLHPDARLSAQEAQLIYDWAKESRREIRRELAAGTPAPASEGRRSTTP